MRHPAFLGFKVFQQFPHKCSQIGTDDDTVPVPYALVRAYCLEKKLDTPAHVFTKETSFAPTELTQIS